MERKKEQRERRLKQCKHFNGLLHNACGAGVVYADVKDSNSHPYRWPCMSDGADIPCSMREYPTAEELDAEDKETGQMITNTLLARKAITDVTKGRRNMEGTVVCPVCKTGSVNYTVAYNGHVHAQCTTPHCVSWIE